MITNTSTQRDIQAAIYNKLETLDANQLMLLSLVIDEIKASNKSTLEALANIKDALNGVQVIEKEKVVEKEVLKYVKVPVEDWYEASIPVLKDFIYYSKWPTSKDSGYYNNAQRIDLDELAQLYKDLYYESEDGTFKGMLNDYLGITKYLGVKDNLAQLDSSTAKYNAWLQSKDGKKCLRDKEKNNIAIIKAQLNCC